MILEVEGSSLPRGKKQRCEGRVGWLLLGDRLPSHRAWERGQAFDDDLDPEPFEQELRTAEAQVRLGGASP